MNYQEAIRAMFTAVDAALSPLASVIIYPNTSTAVPSKLRVSAR